ncbi:unnamed protein product [Prunus armeniaca]
MPPSAKKKSNAPLEPHEQLLERPILLPWLLELDALIRIDPPAARIVALTCQTKTFPKPPTVMTAALDLQETDPIAPIVMTMVITSIPAGSFTGIQKVIDPTNLRKIMVVHLPIMFRKAKPRMRCSLLCPAFQTFKFSKCWLSCMTNQHLTRNPKSMPLPPIKALLFGGTIGGETPQHNPPISLSPSILQSHCHHHRPLASSSWSCFFL